MKVVVVSGPTASGKTDLAIELAGKYNGEVVNFDSLLLYQEISIGTAKPSPEEMNSVPHHMISVRSIQNPMNAADYARDAFVIVEKILQEKKPVFLVGGSGFYLQALLKGMYESATTPPEVLDRSNALYESEGINPFLDYLKGHDPESLKRYHENDHYRIRRAVEHFWTTGQKLSLARSEKDDRNEKLESPTIHPWEVLHIYLDLPKDEHLEIIQKRTKKMLSSGLIEEVKDLLNRGFSGNEKPLQSIGYKEALDFLRGEFSDLSSCEERIVISTRQLAKSQRTWFNRDKFKKKYHPLLERQNIFQEVDEFLKSKDQG